jgi:hypothetical protein
MSFTASVFNIDFTGSQTPTDVNDNLLNAHIHGGPLNPATGTRAVVWGFFGSPFNDNNPASPQPPGAIGDCVPFTTGVGGTCSGVWDLPEGNGAGVNLASQLPFILSNQDYINFHTTQNPGGEIRGQILAVPEPASLALASIGAIGLLAGALSRRRSV